MLGRFGVGLTLGGISFSRRIEVYSRTSGEEPFYFTYLDLNEIQKGKQIIPAPIKADPPNSQMQLLNETAGTIIVFSNCERLQFDPIKNQGIRADEQIKGLRSFLGRTYRKFLSGGLHINLHDTTSEDPTIYIHDPLYMMGPTIFDTNIGIIHRSPVKIKTNFGARRSNGTTKTYWKKQTKSNI